MLTWGGGGGGTPFYKPYRFVPPQRVWFLTGTDFAHFGLESAIGFEETTGMYERIYRFNSR